MKPIVWMSEPLTRTLRERLTDDVVSTSSPSEFIAYERDGKTVSFLDSSTLAKLDRFAADLGARPDQPPPPEWRRLVTAVSSGSVVAMCDEPIEQRIDLLPSHPWLSHLVSTSIFAQPIAKNHLTHVLSMCASRDPRLLDWLQPVDAGKRVRLTHAVRRAERIEKMSQFFAGQGASPLAVRLLGAAAEELLVNAFYEAPIAAGATGSRLIERTRDVTLPEELACDIAYGCRDELAMIRVRDPFGALTQERLVHSFMREPKGLARVFNSALLFAVSVIKNRHTEVLYAIPIHAKEQPKPLTFHFFNREGARQGMWKLAEADTGDDGLNRSVTVTFIE